MEQGTCSLGEGECSIAGKITHGWCPKHYQRIRKYGDPSVIKRIFGDDEARFLSYVDHSAGPDGCWPWTGYVDEMGYGIFGVGDGLRKAHIWAYEHFVKPIPDGLQIDHLCHTEDTACPGGPCPHRRCVNYLRPHLEPVVHRENVLRGRSTKLSDETVAGLHARWLAGEMIMTLAAEVGVHPATLPSRFERIVYGPHLPPADKISDEAIAGLYVRWRAGESQQVLADEVGVSRATLSRRFSSIALATSVPATPEPPPGLLF